MVEKIFAIIVLVGSISFLAFLMCWLFLPVGKELREKNKEKSA